MEPDFFPEVVSQRRPAPARRPSRAARELARALTHPMLAQLPEADRPLLGWVLEFRRGIVGRGPSVNRCFMVCAPLQGVLSGWSGGQIELEAVSFWREGTEYEHYFLRRADRSIIDPTADQFNEWGVDLPPVYIGPEPEMYRQWRERPPLPKKKRRAAERRLKAIMDLDQQHKKRATGKS